MHLYLLRHAIAAPRGVYEGVDADRPLTAEGVQKLKTAVKGMRAMDLEIDRMLSSPFRRARQTAEIVAAAFDLDVEIRESLLPTAHPRQLVADLIKVSADSPPADCVVVVGHQPHLGALASLLISGGDRVQIDLKKASLCELIVDLEAARHPGPCATLSWLLAPSQLRRLAE